MDEQVDYENLKNEKRLKSLEKARQVKAQKLQERKKKKEEPVEFISDSETDSEDEKSIKFKLVNGKKKKEKVVEKENNDIREVGQKIDKLIELMSKKERRSNPTNSEPKKKQIKKKENEEHLTKTEPKKEEVQQNKQNYILF